MKESEVGEKDTRRHYPAGLEDGGRGYERRDEAAFRRWKGKETDCTLEYPEGMQLCQHLVRISDL